MDVNPLHVAGNIDPNMPLVIVRDIALRFGLKRQKLSSLDEVRDVASLGKDINADCSVLEVTKNGRANWEGLCMLVNPEEEWTTEELLTVFNRLYPLFTLKGWDPLSHEQREQIVEIIGTAPLIENPTPRSMRSIPPYIAYGVARRFGYVPSSTDGLDRILNVLLHIGHGSRPSIEEMPQLVIEACLLRAPLAYNSWYLPTPHRIEDPSSATAVALRDAAREFSLNLFYCQNPVKELALFRRGDPLSSSDSWFVHWYERNPDYFDLTMRYDSNVPAEMYDRVKILSRYNASNLTAVSAMTCTLEKGPCPGGGHVSKACMTIFRNRRAENIDAATMTEILATENPAYLEVPIEVVYAYMRAYTTAFSREDCARVKLLASRKERIKRARECYIGYRQDSERQARIRRALSDCRNRRELAEALGTMAEFVLDLSIVPEHRKGSEGDHNRDRRTGSDGEDSKGSEEDHQRSDREDSKGSEEDHRAAAPEVDDLTEEEQLLMTMLMGEL